MKKRIIISGGTGFIGKELISFLSNNYDIVIISTNIEKAKGIFDNKVHVIGWGEEVTKIYDLVKDAYGIINLSGASIAAKRWTKKRKNILLYSRLNTIEKWEYILKSSGAKPHVFIQASAIGYYGDSISFKFDETSGSRNNLFLSEIVQKTEKATLRIEKFVQRLIISRLSIVLGSSGGMIKKIVLPYKLGIGARFGAGNQWMSWIHIQDLVRLFQLFLKDSSMNGIYNLTAPKAVTNREFHKTVNAIFGKKLNWILPSFVVWLLFGQMGEETLLSGQNVRSVRLEKNKYTFLFTDIKSALKNILNK